MKIAFTISDAGAALHVGGQVETTTHLVEIPETMIPPAVRNFMECKKQNGCYWSMSISVVDELGSA